jgi:hypothetical protein
MKKSPIAPNNRIGLSKIENSTCVTEVRLNLNLDVPLFLLVRVAGISFTLNPRAQTLERISR